MALPTVSDGQTCTATLYNNAIAPANAEFSTPEQALIALKSQSASSAATFTLATWTPIVVVTGTTNITTITATTSGTIATFFFTGTLTLVNGSNLNLLADFQAYPGASITLECDGTNWNRVSSHTAGELRLATVAGVNLNQTSKVTLYTVPTSRTAIFTRVIVRNASTSLTTASFGLGRDVSCTDFASSATHTELTGATLYSKIDPKSGATTGAAADIFGVKCSIAQGGAATADFDVFGYLI